MEIVYTITVGNILTTVSLLLTALGLFIAIWRESTRRTKEYADKVREAATELTAKLDRIEAVMLSFYDDIQVLFVDADNNLSAGESAIQVRDSLYRGIAAAYAINRKSLSDEQIESAYERICVYSPEAREEFRATFKKMESSADIESALLQQTTQKAIFKASDNEGSIISATLGNMLRVLSHERKNSLSQLLQHETSHFRDELSKIHYANDKALREKLIKIAPSPPNRLSDPSLRLSHLDDIRGNQVMCSTEPLRLSGREASFMRHSFNRLTFLRTSSLTPLANKSMLDAQALEGSLKDDELKSKSDG